MNFLGLNYVIDFIDLEIQKWREIALILTGFVGVGGEEGLIWFRVVMLVLSIQRRVLLFDYLVGLLRCSRIARIIDNVLFLISSFTFLKIIKNLKKERCKPKKCISKKRKYCD